MLGTFISQLGTVALTPFFLFGGQGQITQDTQITSDALRAQAQVHTNVNADTSASWRTEDLLCTDLTHTLAFGSMDWGTGGEVTKLQKFLRAEGYLRSQPSGFFGQQTTRAVRAFQGDEGLTVSGRVDASTRTEVEAISCDDEDPDTTTDLDITGIAAPSALEVNQEGTWTVTVEGKHEGNLRYAVTWGDEATRARIMSAAESSYQTSATFTHTYGEAGTYTPTFTFTDAAGNTVTESAAAVTVSEDLAVEITSLSKTSGYAGQTITITGSGFVADSSVYLGNTKVSTSSVTSDTSLTFTVPALTVGQYDLTVRNANGTSNTLRFDLKAEAKARVSISGIDAPVRLNVNEEGTWTVNVDTNTTGNLKYSVVWGDEGMFRALFSGATETQTSSTFTHTYDQTGTYTPKFTVTDENGKKATVGATVVVTQ